MSTVAIMSNNTSHNENNNNHSNTQQHNDDDVLDNNSSWINNKHNNNNNSTLLNPKPNIYNIDSDNDDDNDDSTTTMDEYELSVRDEIYSIIRHIRDPEHPYTLEELAVVNKKLIYISYNDNKLYIRIEYIPTVPHCSLATLIGLCIRYKVMCDFNDAVIDIYVVKDSHSTSDEINKQLNDKERACAAMENPPLRDTVLELVSNQGKLQYNE